jgi:hypothetical protein
MVCGVLTPDAMDDGKPPAVFELMKNDVLRGPPRTLAVAAESLTPLARMKESLAGERKKKHEAGGLTRQVGTLYFVFCTLKRVGK